MLFLMGLSSFVSAITCGIAIHKRKSPRAGYYILLTLAISVYALGRTFESAATGLESAYFGVILSYIGLPYIPVFMLLFLLNYYEIKINRKPWIFVWVPLILTTVFVIVPELRHLYYLTYYFSPGPPIAAVVVQGSAYYYAMFGYHALLSITCLSLAIWGVVKFSAIKRRSSILVFISVFLPALSEVAYVLGYTPMGLELTPIALSFSSLLLCVAVFRLNMLRVLPLAKDIILEKMSDAFILTDLDRKFIEANESAQKQFPALADMQVGELFNVSDIFPNLAESPDSHSLVSVEIENEHRYYHLVETLIEENAKQRCLIFTLHDITETRKLMDELKSMATYDNMTGIYNRASFYQLSTNELDHASSRRTDVCALAIDIDKFKDVNDTYGHFCGDLVIKEVVVRIADRLRKADIFGRVGGDEFSVVLPNTTLENAKTLAESLQDLISAGPFEYNNKEFPVTISIGVALYDPKKHVSLESFLMDVDSALYKSKNAGRNCVYTYQGEE